MEAGKKRLAGDTERQASSGEVKDLLLEMGALKELVADLTIENRLLKKSTFGDEGDPSRDTTPQRSSRSSGWSRSRGCR